MIEANTTYLWQTQSGGDAEVVYASNPDSFNRIHADMGSGPVPTFSFFEKHVPATGFSIS